MESSALTCEQPTFTPPAVVSLLGTPPHTPTSTGQTTKTPISVPSLRTPRKLQHPQRSTVSESKKDSVIVRFRLVQNEDQSVPSLSISTTALARSTVSRAKRRLFTSDCDSLDYSDFDIRVNKFPRLSSSSFKRMQKSKYTPTQSEMDGTEADDEMEQMAFSVNYLSPPYSPVEGSSAMETSPPESLQSQRNHRTVSNSIVNITPKVKTCASCKTKKTPLWRDSDDGTPYCNACGIRFKKYHVRCSACFYIPRKDEKVNNSCCLCGSRLVHCRHHWAIITTQWSNLDLLLPFLIQALSDSKFIYLYTDYIITIDTQLSYIVYMLSMWKVSQLPPCCMLFIFCHHNHPDILLLSCQ